MSNAKTVMSQAANTWAGPTYIEDVFSTYLYTGNGSTQTITNGIDLAGEGGLVWIKRRTGLAKRHYVFDTLRGVGNEINTDSTEAEETRATALTAFNTDGFSIGSNSETNTSSEHFASWTFRKAPRFFDVVTYTGDGTSSQIINHTLDSTPGCIMVKTINSAENWVVYHRGRGRTRVLRLNSNISEITDATVFPANPNSTTFTVGSGAVNTNGNTYVAYVFAHNAGGFGSDEDQSVISCGFYSGSTSDVKVTLGWEPQFVLIKSATSSTDWILFDNMRGITAKGVNQDSWLEPNTSNAEASGADGISADPDGFTVGGFGDVGSSGQTYIYIAIRRGPMRQPTSATDVFDVTANSGAGAGTSVSTGFPVDATLVKCRSDASTSTEVWDRLRGSKGYLFTDSTAAEGTAFSSDQWLVDDMDGFTWSAADGFSNKSGRTYVNYSWRRAPGFFDVVAYTGDGVAGRTVSHNLGVAPEMMIVKSRSAAGNWATYHFAIGATHLVSLNTQDAANPNFGVWNNTAPTDSVFSLGSNTSTNRSGATFIAYLFATLPGVSKVGSYTGNGSIQTIDCGFTSGARFILIKRTDSTGDWYVWDTERGIVAANDPHLSLNTTAAEVTTDDSVDPDSSGFIVNQVAATNINVSSASYIFYAIA